MRAKFAWNFWSLATEVYEFVAIAALVAHPCYALRFKEDLRQPGLRVPITANHQLFMDAVELGREVVWLHTYGERMADPLKGRPKGPPRLPKPEAPSIPAGGEISGSSSQTLPETLDYNISTKRLSIGGGYIDNVSKQVWEYEVSGKNILRQWFSSRRQDRSRPLIGDKRPPSPLDGIQPGHWLPEYTTDLMNLLHVIGRLVKLESKQKELLDRICKEVQFNYSTLHADGALTSPPRAPGSKIGAAISQPSFI